MAGESLKRAKVAEYAEQGGWLSAYYDLLACTYTDETGVEHKLAWQQAAFIAWDCAPKATRSPDTMCELAQLLNYKSEQVFYGWRRKAWYRALVLEVRQRIMLPYLVDIDRKTIEAALAEDGRAGVAARKLFYEAAGVMGKSGVTVEGETGPARITLEWGDARE